MAIQFRNLSSSEVATYTPLAAEPVYNRDTGELIVGDGTTAGGIIIGSGGGSGYVGSGYSGFSGRSGYSGNSGFSGISGFSGFSGISGFSGFSGISGFSGYSGNSGFSFSGYSGAAGSGAPGGSTTQVQYNNAGVFGGINGMTYSSGANKISINSTVLSFDFGTF